MGTKVETTAGEDVIITLVGDHEKNFVRCDSVETDENFVWAYVEDRSSPVFGVNTMYVLDVSIVRIDTNEVVGVK